VKVRLLGTAAGGGFPQWNCACSNCDGLRRGTIRARPRRELCVAVSGNDRDWFLINAPPDVHAQIASFAPLAPDGLARGTSIAGVLLTGADLDNVLGLMTLREGPPLTVFATAGMRRALEMGGLSLPRLLENYAPPIWRDPARVRSPLPPKRGRTSGLEYEMLEVDCHQPKYLDTAGSAREHVADRVGYTIWDINGKRLVVLPGVSTLTPGIPTPKVDLSAHLRDADLLLIDGTFWSEDELRRNDPRARTATEMGHLCVGGSSGSLELLTRLNAGRRIYVHINNTNPILNEDSPEHAAVRAAGALVGYDGLEIEL
jgi:pyrroloquinoline quinone biosynthesis protein B